MATKGERSTAIAEATYVKCKRRGDRDRAIALTFAPTERRTRSREPLD